MSIGHAPTNVKPARASLAEPFFIAKFWRSRNHSEHVRVELSEFKGHPLVNIRLWQTGTDGIDRPTTKGIAVSVRKLPALARYLAQAEAKARELGLLNDSHDEAAPAHSEVAE